MKVKVVIVSTVTVALGQSSEDTPLISCAYAVSLYDGLSCAAECAAAFQISLTHPDMWALDPTLYDAPFLDNCIVPVGRRVILAPKETVQAQSQFSYAADGSIFRSNAPLPPAVTPITNIPYHPYPDPAIFTADGWIDSRQISVTFNTYRTALRFDRATIKEAVVNPLKLTYATLQQNGRVFYNDNHTCVSVSIQRPNRFAIDTDESVFPFVHSGQTGDCIPNAPLRIDNVFTSGAYKIKVPEIAYFPIRTPSFANIIQQWLLTQHNSLKEDPKNLINSDLVFAVEHREDAEGPYKLQNTKSPSYQLEVFTTFNWLTSLDQECTQYTTCASCTAKSTCYWCDASAVIVDQWAYWAGFPGIAPNGSCGMAPQACAFIGAEPFADHCRPVKNQHIW